MVHFLQDLVVWWCELKLTNTWCGNDDDNENVDHDGDGDSDGDDDGDVIATGRGSVCATA